MASIPISIARRRAALAKRGLVFGSVLAFAATIGLARSGHPATAASPTTSSTSVSSATQSNTGTGSFGQAQVSPATSAQTPSVSTGAS
ncbi:MAG TPA: hypothetical protein VG186_06045 [Solirubrobacteraceae bacterium]|jgi:hypothetical protein|nr:hypothetical protein [Solirubrobacteraceae bacterium]